MKLTLMSALSLTLASATQHLRSHQISLSPESDAKLQACCAIPAEKMQTVTACGDGQHNYVGALKEKCTEANLPDITGTGAKTKQTKGKGIDVKGTFQDIFKNCNNAARTSKTKPFSSDLCTAASLSGDSAGKSLPTTSADKMGGGYAENAPPATATNESPDKPQEDSHDTPQAASSGTKSETTSRKPGCDSELLKHVTDAMTKVQAQSTRQYHTTLEGQALQDSLKAFNKAATSDEQCKLDSLKQNVGQVFEKKNGVKVYKKTQKVFDALTACCKAAAAK